MWSAFLGLNYLLVLAGPVTRLPQGVRRQSRRGCDRIGAAAVESPVQEEGGGSRDKAELFSLSNITAPRVRSYTDLELLQRINAVWVGSSTGLFPGMARTRLLIHI